MVTKNILKMVLVLIIASIGTLSSASQVFTDNSDAKVATITPIRICLWPKKWQWPKSDSVWGLNLGIGNSIGNNNYVAGVDLAYLSFTNNVYGLQASAVNVSTGSRGVQIGLWNQGTEDTSGMQIGIINVAQKGSKQLQIGLWNGLGNGFLPVFPIINFSVR